MHRVTGHGDDDALEARLRRWVAARHPGAPVEIASTHLSVLALTDDRAYKVKRALRLPFVDLSTPAARARNAQREVALNQRFAPDVYLGVETLPAARAEALDASGGMAPGEAVVVMRRLPEPARLSTRVAGGAAVDACLDRLAADVARWHAAAASTPTARVAASHETVAGLWEQGFTQTARYEGGVLDRALATRVRVLVRRYLAGRAALFEHRIASGRAVDGHGDLLAEDVFCLDDGPRAIDCLEFDDALRGGDALADAAFLAMDLERLGRPDLARRFLDHYRAAAGDRWPASLAHCYVAYRAHVRMKVACIRAEQGDDRARSLASQLLALAHAHAEAGRVRLVLVGGPPATGKTTLARALADHTGFPVLRSDEVRKELAGVAVTDRVEVPLGRGIYGAEWTARTYAVLLDRARRLLALGESVILDATWGDEEHRVGAAEVAAAAHVDLVALRCATSPAVAATRARRRRTEGRDASDAGPGIAAALAARFTPWPGASTVDTSAPPDAAAVAACALVGPT